MGGCDDTVSSKTGPDNTASVAVNAEDCNSVACEGATGGTVSSKTGSDTTASDGTVDGSSVSGESGAGFADVLCSDGDNCIAGAGGGAVEMTVLVVVVVINFSTFAPLPCEILASSLPSCCWLF